MTLTAYDPILMEDRNIDEWLNESQDNIVFFIEEKSKSKSKSPSKSSNTFCLKKSYFIAPPINDILLECVIHRNQLNVNETYKSKTKAQYRNIGFYIDKKLIIDNKEFVKTLQKPWNIFKLIKKSDKKKLISMEFLELSKLGLVKTKFDNLKEKQEYNKNFPQKIDIYFESLMSKALYNYSFQWDQPINRYLLQGDQYFETPEFKTYFRRYGPSIEEAKLAVKDKISYLDKCFLEVAIRTEKDTTKYYRGMTRPYYLNGSETIAAMTEPVKDIGDSFIAKNFTSISKNFQVALRFSGVPRNTNRCCIYEIELDKGIPHVDMVLTTQYKHEKEILLPRNILFTLTKIINNPETRFPQLNTYKPVTLYVLKASLLHDDQFTIDNGCYIHNIASIEIDKPANNTPNNIKPAKKQIVPELSENIQKIGRCPKGTRRNKTTGVCESSTTQAETQQTNQPSPVKKTKLPNCPKGTRRNKKTGNCE